MELGFDAVAILRLSLQKKVGIGVLILIILGGGYWYFSLGAKLQRLERGEKVIAQQKREIAEKQQALLDLPRLRAELAALKVQEAKAARKLPSKKEIPALLTDISNAGHEQGLEFLLFAPKKEIPLTLYAKVPVEVTMRGPYHETMLFMNSVARLSRIVTFSNLKLKPKKGELETKAWVMTYRFLNVDERPQAPQRGRAVRR